MTASRREFLTNSMLGAAAAGLAATAVGIVSPREASAQGPPKGNPIAGRWGTIGASGPESFAVAKKLALDGVEIEATRGRPGDVLDCCKPETQKSYLEAIKKTGIHLASICMGHLNSYPVFADPRAKQWIEATIDATAAMGAKVILVPFFGRGDLRMKGSRRPDPAKRDKTIEVLKSVAPRAEEKGISLGLENTLTAEDNMAIVEKVGSPAVRVYYDIGNSTYNGYDVPKEIRMLGTKLICQIHFKDGGFLLGRGKVDTAAVRDAMVEIGYKGWIVLETSRRPLGTELSAVHNAGFIRGLFCS